MRSDPTQLRDLRNGVLKRSAVAHCSSEDAADIFRRSCSLDPVSVAGRGEVVKVNFGRSVAGCIDAELQKIRLRC